MKKTFFLPYLFMTVLLSICVRGFSQVNEDSAMLANSEQWKVEQKGLFGLSKPSFGIFTTLNVGKMDSAWIRNDIDDGYHKAIAGLFAVIIAIKDF
ncbi:MAG TPA: hypothetical protein VGP55_05540 [Chitinophagaceae bacterium]|nr:hypothetical protein [Chitinophagaceae bacterium]